MTRIRTRRVVYTLSLSSVGPSSHEERGGREDRAAPGDGFWSKERIPGVRDACGESRKGAKKAREAVCPIARRCLFGRRA